MRHRLNIVVTAAIPASVMNNVYLTKKTLSRLFCSYVRVSPLFLIVRRALSSTRQAAFPKNPEIMVPSPLIICIGNYQYQL